MKQLDLARRAGISPTTVFSYYHDKNLKKLDTRVLSKMCKVLDCKIEDLLEYIPDET